jgi:hypothetical protein
MSLFGKQQCRGVYERTAMPLSVMDLWQFSLEMSPKNGFTQKFFV